MAKRIVICSDGTWNHPGNTVQGKVRPTNVVRMAQSILPVDADGTQQAVFYDAGIGTGFFDRIRGGLFGVGLSQNIKDAYRFLVSTYQKGDELYFFGFSRGAYTVRSTVGFIHNCGLLKRRFVNRINAAYALYRRHDSSAQPAGHEAKAFRRSFSRRPKVKFIGVWDTVGALGIPFLGRHWINRFFRFHDVKLNSIVENAVQALAIDETCSALEPAIWEQPRRAKNQTLEQVWFAGSHANVGGGSEDAGLSDIAFLWMVEKARSHGLAIDTDYLGETLCPNPLGVIAPSLHPLLRALPDRVRTISAGLNSRESIAQSVLDRVEEARRPKYLPPNLIAYLVRDSMESSSHSW